MNNPKPTNPDQARQYARLMGILYGAIVGMELTDQEITYNAIVTIMRQHCTPTELARVCRELHRYNAIVEQAEQEQA